MITGVQYFTVANEEFPGLVRRCTVTNTGSTAVNLSMLDGLTKIQPFGVNGRMSHLISVII